MVGDDVDDLPGGEVGYPFVDGHPLREVGRDRVVDRVDGDRRGDPRLLAPRTAAPSVNRYSSPSPLTIKPEPVNELS